MTPTALNKAMVSCSIGTLPSKLRLQSSCVIRAIRQKSNPEEPSLFAENEVQVWVQDEESDNFQLYLRAGMKDQMQELLKTRGLEIFL